MSTLHSDSKSIQCAMYVLENKYEKLISSFPLNAIWKFLSLYIFQLIFSRCIETISQQYIFLLLLLPGIKQISGGISSRLMIYISDFLLDDVDEIGLMPRSMLWSRLYIGTNDNIVVVCG